MVDGMEDDDTSAGIVCEVARARATVRSFCREGEDSVLIFIRLTGGNTTFRSFSICR